jgi:glucose-6-phosphate isomerase
MAGADFQQLKTHQEAMEYIHMRDLFADDQKRFERFSLQIDGLLFDYSKHRMTEETIGLLVDLAIERDLEATRDALFAGKPLNTSENRSVLHPALRGSVDTKLEIDGENVADFVQKTRAQIREVSEKIRSDNTVADVIHIGIGGSDLGPRMVCRALQHLNDGPRLHFLSNIDGQDVTQLLKSLNAENTAIIIASKTFTTQETMSNAQLVCDWLGHKNNVYAITSNTQAAIEFGVNEDHILPLRNWIGGRFSLWSAVGLPIAVSVGFKGFEALLSGAKDADDHFLTAPLDQNIPVLMGMLGIWYRNIWDFNAHAILPYIQSLEHFPRCLQQLEMESNGKSVSADGSAVNHSTSGVVFGETGTDAQHAFMQMIHQGSDIVPTDFIIAAKVGHDYPSHHAKLNANALAQSQALMQGLENKDEPHRHFDGNRPSSTFILDELTPRNLGLLIALYEHKIFVQGVIWGINSFDQWGVELGKILAQDIEKSLKNEETDDASDCSTENLISYLKAKT